MGQAIQLKQPINNSKECIYHYIHTENCYTDVEPLFPYSSDCCIKKQTSNIIVNVGLSMYSSKSC